MLCALKEPVHQPLMSPYPADPEKTPAERFPPDYLQRVKAVHEQGGYGSTG